MINNKNEVWHANIFDYLDWRGDLSFAEARFTPVDGLILALLSYIDFDDIVPEALDADPVTLEAAAAAFIASGADRRMIASRLYSVDNYVKLLARLAESERFRQLRLTGYANSIDPDAQKQFAALTILCGDVAVNIPESPSATAVEPIAAVTEQPRARSAGQFFKKLFGLFSAKPAAAGDTVPQAAGQPVPQPVSQSAGETILISAIPPDDEEDPVGDTFTFISFRGTDNTLVGWKEDFNMSFLTAVPSQLEAAAYLQRVADRYLGNLLLGGHSKGGNLAAYGAAFCDCTGLANPGELQDMAAVQTQPASASSSPVTPATAPAVQPRIVQVFNFDGPGFTPGRVHAPGYQNMVRRIRTYLPQSSIVGMLMEHEEAYTVVNSTQTGFNQHDAFSWDVQARGFVSLDSVDDSSKFVDRTITEWLRQLDDTSRRQFIDAFYEILTATGAQTLDELTADWFRSAGLVVRSVQQLDRDTKKLMMRAFGLLVQAARANMPDVNPLKRLAIPFWRSEETDLVSLDESLEE